MRETDLMRHPAALALIRYPNQISLSDWLFIDFCSDALSMASLCARKHILLNSVPSCCVTACVRKRSINNLVWSVRCAQRRKDPALHDGKIVTI